MGGTAEVRGSDNFAMGIATSGSTVYVVGSKVGMASWSNATHAGYNVSVDDALLVKYTDNNGLQEAWNRTFDFGGNDVLYDAVVDSNGNVYATGVKRTATTDQLVIAKFDSDGNEAWRTLHTSPSSGLGVALDSSGYPWVAGGVGDPAQHFMARFNPSTGSLVSSCTKQYAGFQSMQVSTDIAILSGGDLAVSGIEFDGSSLQSRAVAMRFTTGCSEQWRQVRTDSGGQGAQFWSISRDSNDNIALAGAIGHLFSTGVHDFAVQLRWPNGTLRWEDLYDQEEDPLHEDFVANAVSIDTNGNVYASGFTGMEAKFYGVRVRGHWYNHTIQTIIAEYVTAKWTVGGTREWVATYSAVNHDHFGQGNALKSDGSTLYVTGAKLKYETVLDPTKFTHAFTLKYTSL